MANIKIEVIFKMFFSNLVRQIYYLGKKYLRKDLILLIKPYLSLNKSNLLIKDFAIITLNIDSKIFVILVAI